MTRELDAIIFGATGFTGEIVVRCSVDLLANYKWGIAGRNKSKLEGLLREVGSKVNRDLSHIPIVIADVTDSKSIMEMAKQTKIILNCCGPYDLYGEIVVKSCAEVGTHHVDVSAEPQYIDSMTLKYHELAEKNKCYIISTCGFDSIPSEIGVLHAEKTFDGTINSVEMYLENTFERLDPNSRAVLHNGTWESILRAIKEFRRVFSLKSEVMKQIQCPRIGPKLWMKPYIQKPSFGESYFLPIPFGDLDIVERSQKRLYELERKRPIQYTSYLGFHSILWPLVLPFYVPLILIMILIPCTFKLLLKYPGFFTFGRMTRKGPTVRNLKGHTFQMTFKATGWAKDQPLTSTPKKVQLTRLSGPDPFYGLTAMSLILTAKSILEENDKIPGSGGVLSPGVAFHKTNLLEELGKYEYGLKFEVLK